MRNVKVTIAADGTMRFVYADNLRALLDEGTARINRASHVEPQGTQWTADMAPVGGPVLGPYDTREAALAAEVAWLDLNLTNVSL